MKEKYNIHYKSLDESLSVIKNNILIELLKESESRKYGWDKFDESWLDKEGLTTCKEDRKTVKHWLKSMGLN